MVQHLQVGQRMRCELCEMIPMVMETVYGGDILKPVQTEKSAFLPFFLDRAHVCAENMKCSKCLKRFELKGKNGQDTVLS